MISCKDKIFDGYDSSDILYSCIIKQDCFEELAESFLELFDDYGKSRKKRMYYFFVESVQNVLIHGLNNDIGSVFYILKKRNENTFLFVTGNPIRKEDLHKVTQKIDMINNLPRDQIDHLYFQSISNGYFTEKRTAGLGLMQMKRKANYDTMNYFIIECETFFYFYLVLKYKVG